MAPCVFSALSCCVVFVTLVVTSVWGGVFIDGFGQWKAWGVLGQGGFSDGS